MNQLALWPDAVIRRDPTPEEIAEECKVIQAEWDEDDEYERRACQLRVRVVRTPVGVE